MLHPIQFELEKTTIWSFPDRGSWATHNGKYRGNWSPYIPRNIIERYSKENEWVLDQFVGSGTTLIEAKLLSRNAIGIDINPKAVLLTKQQTDFSCESQSRLEIREGNASDLGFIKSNSIHLICTHPPYADIIRYSDGISGDISQLEYEPFLKELDKVAENAYRVLKPGRHCAYMIGDVRRHGKLFPLGFKSMEVFCSVGFELKEIVIKEQHNCRSSDYWESKDNSFLLLAHEYIFILRKPMSEACGRLAEEVYLDCLDDPIDHSFDKD